jgi:hypothetical protein
MSKIGLILACTEAAEVTSFNYSQRRDVKTYAAAPSCTLLLRYPGQSHRRSRDTQTEVTLPSAITPGPALLRMSQPPVPAQWLPHTQILNYGQRRDVKTYAAAPSCTLLLRYPGRSHRRSRDTQTEVTAAPATPRPKSPFPRRLRLLPATQNESLATSGVVAPPTPKPKGCP